MNMNNQCPVWFQNLGWVCLAVFKVVLVIFAIAFVGFLVFGLIASIIDLRKTYERRSKHERR